MRTIKFRAEALDESFGLIYFDLHKSILSGDSEVFYVSGIPCKTGTEQEFTGLLDKNGKKIWEGDIIKYGAYHNPFVIEWFNQYCGFCRVWNNEVYQLNENSDIEVIGNLYETPNLI